MKSPVVFRPVQSTETPNVNPSFPCVPSAMYFYRSRTGERIPMLNNIGSPEEQLLSLTIWYSMKSNEIFPLQTVYAKAREDQIGVEGRDRPNSEIALSMKNRLRQYGDSSDWFFEDRFQLLIGQAKRFSLDKFINDFYRFPLAPSSDPFEVARLLEPYIGDGDESHLRRYLQERGVTHLLDHSFGYYTTYELFFLLTRYASYPMTENQLRLAERRARTTFNSPERVFIDAIFDYQIYDIAGVLQLIDQIANEGPGPAGRRFNTTHADWFRWGDEYLKNAEVTPQPIQNFAGPIYLLSEKLYTWTDDQIDELARRINLDLPLREEYPNRISYIESIAGTIALYRADPTDTARWRVQTEGQVYLPQMTVAPH